jgi:tryptophanyl-tRNA synthetase
VLAERYARSNHGSLKKDVAEAVEEALRKPRAEFARLREDRTFLAQVVRDSAKKAQEHSDDEMMREVRRRIGLS